MRHSLILITCLGVALLAAWCVARGDGGPAPVETEDCEDTADAP